MEGASGLGVCVLGWGTAGRRDPARGEHFLLGSCPLTSRSCCRNRSAATAGHLGQRLYPAGSRAPHPLPFLPALG